MTTIRRRFLKTGAALSAAGVVVAVSSETINSRELHRTGTDRGSDAVAVNCDDRQVTFGAGKVAGDGKDAIYRDGSKVTAADVKWSFDRAVPYQAIFETAAYHRGGKLWGGTAEYRDTAWPRRTPYDTDMARAKAFMATSGFKDGFETTLSISTDLASRMEPMAPLIREAVARLGIRTTIETIPGANWRTASLAEKKLPLHLENFGGWLNTPDDYFF